MKKPKISVIMPAYNAQEFIAEAIESILNQTFEDFEFIIIDDCSQDTTSEIIKKYSEKDKRIAYIKNMENLKICRTLNKAIRASRGKYVARMDADDWSYPDRLEKQYKFMEAHPEIGVSGGTMHVCDENLNFLNYRRYELDDVSIRKKIFYFNPFSHPLIIIKRDVLEKIGYYDEFLKDAEDYELYFRIGTVAKFGNLPDVLIKYRVSPNSATICNSKRLELLTLFVRLKAAAEYGYKLRWREKVYWLGQLISMYIIPYRIKYWWFNSWRARQKIQPDYQRVDNINQEQILTKVEINELREHIGRYAFAARHIKPNSRILDCASGAGYGSYVLSILCPTCKIIGVELDKNAYNYAKGHFQNINIQFICTNIFDFDRKKNNFDYIVSFETIEHIKEYRSFIALFYQSLKKNGQLFLSSPDKTMVSPYLSKPLNTFHVKEFDIQELKTILQQYFPIVEPYIQKHNYNLKIMKIRTLGAKIISPISQKMTIGFLNLLRMINNIINKKDYILLNKEGVAMLMRSMARSNRDYPRKYQNDSIYHYLFQVYICRKD